MTLELRCDKRIIRVCASQAVPRVGDILGNPVSDGQDYRVHAVVWDNMFDTVILDVVPIRVGREEPK